MNESNKKIVFSGLRPTGPCHLGHLAGALRNWLKLQDEYQCFYSIVTWHGFSSEYMKSTLVRENTFEVAADWLSIGLDPKKCTIFVQSDVKEHAELHLLLSMIIPLPWLMRVPTFKEMQKELPEKDLNTYGFLGYPVLQTADIILYKAGIVPVGEDQAYHLELAREITRRFNRLFKDIFPEPQMLLTEVPKLAGTDGRKMSKSFGNAINLKDSREVIHKKISTMMTDVRRKRRSDPGVPGECPAFTLHKAFVAKEKGKNWPKDAVRPGSVVWNAKMSSSTASSRFSILSGKKGESSKVIPSSFGRFWKKGTKKHDLLRKRRWRKSGLHLASEFRLGIT